MIMLEKLRHYPILNQPGTDNIVDKLKPGWDAYHNNACRVLSESELDYKKDPIAILTWHCRQCLYLDDERSNDALKWCCRYSCSTSGKC